MLNIEKYKDDILNTELKSINCSVNRLYNKGICFKDCKDCKKAAMEWLLSEYKESVLNDVEREYLSAVIKPFREEVDVISKFRTFDDSSQYIYISMKDNRKCTLSVFPKGTMYKGMIEGTHYSLKELGL